jgi:hypothetical protein
MPVAPLETIGLFGFAGTSLGPTRGIPWIAPMIFSCLVGIANVRLEGVEEYLLLLTNFSSTLFTSLPSTT